MHKHIHTHTHTYTYTYTYIIIYIFIHTLKTRMVELALENLIVFYLKMYLSYIFIL